MINSEKCKYLKQIDGGKMYDKVILFKSLFDK